MKNSKLAIAIPTYNRCTILKENLQAMLPDIRLYNIPIYISDDSSNDETKIMVETLKCDYPYIEYRHNTPALGHDANCFFTLSLPEEEYIWYLGDSRCIKEGAVQTILKHLNSKGYDYISVNSDGRNLDIPSKVYDDYLSLAGDLGWHITMTGVTIYKQKNILPTQSTMRCTYKNFPQTALVLSGMLQKNQRLLWINDKCVLGNKNTVSYWSEKVFDVFAHDWNRFILSIPDGLNHKQKIALIKSHSRKTGIFGIKAFLRYRYTNVFNYHILRNYFNDIRMSSHLPIIVVLLIAIMPLQIVNFIFKLAKK